MRAGGGEGSGEEVFASKNREENIINLYHFVTFEASLVSSLHFSSLSLGSSELYFFRKRSLRKEESLVLVNLKSWPM